MGYLIVRGMHIHDDDTPVTNFVYAHGELEQKWGYDLVWIPKWGYLPKVDDGIYDAWFVLPDNEITEARVFLWQANDFPAKKGLVVKVGDNENMKYAEMKYNSKAYSI